MFFSDILEHIHTINIVIVSPAYFLRTHAGDLPDSIKSMYIKELPHGPEQDHPFEQIYAILRSDILTGKILPEKKRFSKNLKTALKSVPHRSAKH